MIGDGLNFAETVWHDESNLVTVDFSLSSLFVTLGRCKNT